MEVDIGIGIRVSDSSVGRGKVYRSKERVLVLVSLSDP